MPAATTVTDLAERKKMLVMQAELHRQMIEIERFRLQQKVEVTRERFHNTRWWLLGGVALAGWLSTRRFGSLVKLLPIVVTGWRMIQKYMTAKR